MTTPTTREELIEIMARAFIESMKTRSDTPDKFGENAVKGAMLAMPDALTALEAAGLAVVPVEATEEMLEDAGAIEGWAEYAEPDDADRCHTEWYTAMLNAAPEPDEELVERVARRVDGTGFRSAIHPEHRARNANLREKARHKARAILKEIGRQTDD